MSIATTTTCGQRRANGQARDFVPLARHEQLDQPLAIDERLRRIEGMLAILHESLTAVVPPPADRPSPKSHFTVKEAAGILGKSEYRVREWCRLGRIHAEKADCGRGIDREWRITQEEIDRYRNHGLLPAKYLP